MLSFWWQTSENEIFSHTRRPRWKLVWRRQCSTKINFWNMTGRGKMWENIWKLRESFITLSFRNSNVNFEYCWLLTPLQNVEQFIRHPFCTQCPENTGSGWRVRLLCERLKSVVVSWWEGEAAEEGGGAPRPSPRLSQGQEDHPGLCRETSAWRGEQPQWVLQKVRHIDAP